MQMLPFLLKCTLLILILFFGVLLGMEQANNGLVQMRGYEDNKFADIFQLKKDEFGDLEATVFGNELTSKDIKERQQQLEQMGAYNFFSKLGAELAESITIFLQNILEALVASIQNLLASIGSSTS